MNKINSILFILLLFIAVSCKNTKRTINIKKIGSNKSIIIRMNNDLKKITGIKFPFILVIENLSSSKKEFVKIKYNYGFKEKGVGIELFEKDKKISNNKKKIISAKEKMKYLIYTRHFSDSSKFTQQQFKSSIKKMLKENKDTLHIGTVKEFKINHKELFKQLTKNDSISIQFLDNGKFGERITVPVEW